MSRYLIISGVTYPLTPFPSLCPTIPQADNNREKHLWLEWCWILHSISFDAIWDAHTSECGVAGSWYHKERKILTLPTYKQCKNFSTYILTCLLHCYSTSMHVQWQVVWSNSVTQLLSMNVNVEAKSNIGVNPGGVRIATPRFWDGGREILLYLIMHTKSS